MQAAAREGECVRAAQVLGQRRDEGLDGACLAGLEPLAQRIKVRCPAEGTERAREQPDPDREARLHVPPTPPFHP